MNCLKEHTLAQNKTWLIPSPEKLRESAAVFLKNHRLKYASNGDMQRYGEGMSRILPSNSGAQNVCQSCCIDRDVSSKLRQCGKGWLTSGQKAAFPFQRTSSTRYAQKIRIP